MTDDQLLEENENGTAMTGNNIEIMSNGSRSNGGLNHHNHQHINNVSTANKGPIMSSSPLPSALIEEASYDILEPPDGGTRAWLVMISSFFCNGIIFGIINTYSVIYLCLQEKLKEKGDPEASSKSALVGSLTIGTTFLLSPVAGILTDKIGLRKTAIIGGISTSCGMLLSSFVTHNISALYLTYGVMYGFGAALTYTPSLAILGHYFKRYLGKVNGVVTAGSSVFTAIMPFVLDYLVENCGLNVTLRIVALISSLIVLCALLYKPLQPKLPPKRAKIGQSQFKTKLKNLIYVDNWKKKRYIIWALSIPVALFGYFVPYVHMSKFVKESFPGQGENLPMMCIGISSGLGRIIFGFIADLPNVNRILLQQISFFFIGIMTMFLPVTNSYWLLLVFVLAMGLFDGCFITLLGPIAFDICGPRGASQAIGFLLGLCSFPLTLGPPIAGMIFDHTGSYTIPFVLAGIPPLCGATTMFLIRCIKEETHGTETISTDPAEHPLAKPAWEDGTLMDVKLMNNNGHIPSDRDKSATLASAESLDDVNNTK